MGFCLPRDFTLFAGDLLDPTLMSFVDQQLSLMGPLPYRALPTKRLDSTLSSRPPLSKFPRLLDSPSLSEERALDYSAGDVGVTTPR
jgi:hypothetical protein